jgi:fused signal recognition particle receptor
MLCQRWKKQSFLFSIFFFIVSLFSDVSSVHAITIEDISAAISNLPLSIEELQKLYNLNRPIALGALGIGSLIVLFLLYRYIVKRKKRPLQPQVKEKIPSPPPSEEPVSYVDKLRTGLAKTRQNFLARTVQLFQSRKIDDTLIEDLEESLVLADVGPRAATMITSSINAKIKTNNKGSEFNFAELLKEELRTLLKDDNSSYGNVTEKPYVILVVGVNGVGKTTTIGKLAKHFTDKNMKVILAAGDTFRAAAIEQLEIWAERSSAQLVKHKAGSDPAAVVFDALAAAKSRNADVVIVDTAGRLHTKSNLMEELKKIKRVIGREITHAPHEVLLVVDATSGQNVLQQARIFHEAVSITGIALTKLDGTAKGGIVIAVKSELGLPVKFIGVGEGVYDLRYFNPDEFVNALFESS